MSKNLEIERRFLLKRIPYTDNEFDLISKICQYYLISKKTKKSIRIRKMSYVNNGEFITKYYHTTKKRISPDTCEEIEKEITKSEFIKLKNKSKTEIHKIRHIKKIGKLKWEIDFFSHINLIICEVELPKSNYDLKIPKKIKDNIILEITGIKELSNFSLSEKTLK